MITAHLAAHFEMITAHLATGFETVDPVSPPIFEPKGPIDLATGDGADVADGADERPNGLKFSHTDTFFSRRRRLASRWLIAGTDGP